MILTSLKYTRFEGEPREWRIVEKDVPEKEGTMFGNINLLVGKNAAGKSRTLSSIREIAALLSGRISLKETHYPTERYEITFQNTNMSCSYMLSYRKREIIDESFTLNGELMFSRSQKKFHDPEALEDKVSLLARYKDDEGSYYSQSLVEWATNIRDLKFANQEEKNRWVKDYTEIEQNTTKLKDSHSIIYYYNRGVMQFGQAFTEEVLRCMNEIGYSISAMEITSHSRGYCLDIEEYGQYTITQREMSQGMFRALSFFVQLTFACMENEPICILLDDIGEGLDSDRSKDMVSITIKKINNTNIQFFLTTNDRDVMNRIPLRYWTVIDRCTGNESIVYNYSNSKEIFEDFKYTGLSNYDFLVSDFYKKGFSDDFDDDDYDEEDEEREVE